MQRHAKIFFGGGGVFTNSSYKISYPNQCSRRAVLNNGDKKKRQVLIKFVVGKGATKHHAWNGVGFKIDDWGERKRR